MGASGGAEMKPDKVCTLKNAYIDRAGTIPAKVGDRVARVDWDDGEQHALRLHPANLPTLVEGVDGATYLFFPGGLK